MDTNISPDSIGTKEETTQEMSSSQNSEKNSDTNNHPILDGISKFLSFVFFPLFIPIYGITLLFNMDIFSFYPKRLTILSYYVVIFFTILLPLFFIQLLAITKIISDAKMREKEDRIIPYIITSILFLLGSCMLFRLGMPLFFINISISASIAILIDAIISKWWKISAHMTGIGGLSAGIVLVGIATYVNTSTTLILALIVAGVLASARLQLKRHTPAQIVAGFLNGFISVFLFSLINWGSLLRSIFSPI